MHLKEIFPHELNVIIMKFIMINIYLRKCNDRSFPWMKDCVKKGAAGFS